MLMNFKMIMDLMTLLFVGEDNSTGDYGVILDQNGNAIESNDNIRKYGLLNKTFTTTTTLGGAFNMIHLRNL